MATRVKKRTETISEVEVNLPDHEGLIWAVEDPSDSLSYLRLMTSDGVMVGTVTATADLHVWGKLIPEGGPTARKVSALLLDGRQVLKDAGVW